MGKSFRANREDGIARPNFSKIRKGINSILEQKGFDSDDIRSMTKNEKSRLFNKSLRDQAEQDDWS